MKGKEEALESLKADSAKRESKIGRLNEPGLLYGRRSQTCCQEIRSFFGDPGITSFWCNNHIPNICHYSKTSL